jgi:hypothetical protein
LGTDSANDRQSGRENIGHQNIVGAVRLPAMRPCALAIISNINVPR